MERKTICIDLGHCETTAGIPLPQAGSHSYRVGRLSLEGKDQVVFTQIILTGQQMKALSGHKTPDYQLLSNMGEIKIGNNLSSYVPDGEKFCYFKVAPKDFDKPCGNTDSAKAYCITHGMVMACFAYALVDNIFKYNEDELAGTDRRDVDLLIGCPTTVDWTADKAQQAYARLIRTAANVHNVRIVPESRAAMFSGVENGKNRVSALNGAIVFDFGSSTADCTYMLLGRKMMEFSWTLGAAEVERQMTIAAYQKGVKENGPFNVTMTSFMENEDQLRTEKEEYYNGKYGPKGHPMYCTFEDSVNGSTIEVPMRIYDSFMDRVTKGCEIQVLCDSKTTLHGTWQRLCRTFFETAKKRLESMTYTVKDAAGTEQEKKCTLDTIMLTGGASNMKFVYNLCREVFPKVTVYKENNPSYTVSNGLGWVQISDSNVEYCIEEAEKEVRSKTECGISALKKSLSDAIFDKICTVAEGCTREWADNVRDDLSIRTLEESILKELEAEAVQSELRNLCNQKIAEWKDCVSSAMEEAINTQVARLYSETVARGLVIPMDIWKDLQAGSIRNDQLNVSNILSGIDLTSVGMQIAQWTIIMIATAVGAIVGWGGAIVGFVVGAFAAAFVSDEDLDKPRKRKDRQRVVDTVKKKIRDEKGNLMKNFGESFKQFEEEYPEMLLNSLRAAFEIVTLKRFEM